MDLTIAVGRNEKNEVNSCSIILPPSLLLLPTTRNTNINVYIKRDRKRSLKGKLTTLKLERLGFLIYLIAKTIKIIEIRAI